MPSTYTAANGIELIATGEQSGSWGATTNQNLQIVDRVLSGVGSITLSGTTHTLSTTDGTLSDGMYKVLVLGGTPSGTNTITVAPNDAQKIYMVYNNSGQSVVFTQGSGSNVTVANGDTKMIYTDGIGGGASVVDFTANLAMSSVNITGGSVAGSTITGNVDGRDVSADGTKLDGIEASADVTDATNVAAAGALMDSEVDADIKTLVLPASTTISTFGASLVDDLTNTAARTTLGLGTAATTAATDYATAAQGTKADSALQDADIGSSVQGYATVLANTTASFLTADKTKLDGIEASADVTDATNVTAAGALMDSEVTNLAQVKAFSAADYATAAQGTLATNAAPKSSPTLTGVPAAPTAALGTDTTQLATTEFVQENLLSTVATALTPAATIDIDLASDDYFTVTLDQNTTFTFSNPPVSGRAFAFTLILTQPASAKTIAWPGTVDWAGGSAPAAPGNSEVNAYGFITDDSGTIYYGFLGGAALG